MQKIIPVTDRKMKLDYIHSFNEFGENIIRLYDFDKALAIKFRQAIIDTIISNKTGLNLMDLDFIEVVNCNLVLRLWKEDEGISTSNNKTFYCDLTLETFEKMIQLLEPFCTKETRGYQYLYDIDNPTDFLFSPTGSSGIEED